MRNDDDDIYSVLGYNMAPCLADARLAISFILLQIFSRHRPVMTFLGQAPFGTNDTFIAPTASVIGEVTNWDQSSVWYGAVVRADSSHAITIGFNSSIGEGSVVTTLRKNATLATGFPPVTHIGHYVSVGAGSVLKSCRVDDLVIIGEKCTILEGALVEANTVLEPGTVVPAYARIPSGQKWGGNPATFVANLTDDELDNIKRTANETHQRAKEHILEFLPVGQTYVHLEELERQQA
jgi:carbonic anhydrase/acetyltransferase-like protein (isoleucine patch superfamily)